MVAAHLSLPRGLLLSAWIAACCAAPAPAQGSLDKALEYYQKVIRRKPFIYHALSRKRLAATRSVEALDILLKDYARPRTQERYSRYTIAANLGRFFHEHSWGDKLAGLRARFKGPGDAWLWANTVAADSRPEALAARVAEYKNTEDLWIKAAIIWSLGRAGHDEVAELVLDCIANFPDAKQAGARRLLVGAMAQAIVGNKNSRANPAVDKALRAYIQLLGKDVGLTHSCKMLIARSLTKAVGKEVLYIEPEPWLRLLEQGYEPPKRAGQTVSQVRFFGLTGDGDRICFLIDMSNSMLKKIDPALIPKGPVTGPKKRRKRGQLPTEDDIPWHLIKTRWDLAREHVKIAIQRLDKDKRFCVMWFGDSAGTLKTTKGMIRATRGNVRKVMQELDRIKAQAAPPGKELDAPDGVLKGQTNMHRGLRMAFSLHSRGFCADRDYEYVDLKCMAEGCDTIFLLSDGAPSWDDNIYRDKYYGDMKVVHEQEQKRAAKPTGDITYHGPFDQPNFLMEEVRRLNVFRRLQIHCVGVGEADPNLLRSMAQQSFGQVYFFGRQAKQAAGVR